MIHVIASIELHPGKRDEYLAHFRRLVPEVRAEDGCVAYAPAVDVPSGMSAQGEYSPDVLTVVEQWRDLPALRAHSVAPHMAAFREKAGSLVRGIKLQVLEDKTEE